MRSRAMMWFNKRMQHMGGRCRSPIYRGTDIYGALGWGKTQSNVFISLIAPAGRGATNGMTRLAIKVHHCAL